MRQIGASEAGAVAVGGLGATDLVTWLATGESLAGDNPVLQVIVRGLLVAALGWMLVVRLREAG